MNGGRRNFVDMTQRMKPTQKFRRRQATLHLKFLLSSIGVFAFDFGKRGG